MGKKRKNKEVVNLNIYPTEGATIEGILLSEMFVQLVYLRVKESIKEAIKTKRNTATLFQINNSDYYLEIPKSEWGKSLDAAIQHYSDKEQFEECIDLKALKEEITFSEKELV